MTFQIGINRKQALLFPVCLDEMIPKEHPIRIVNLLFGNLELRKLGFIDLGSAVEVLPAYDAKDFLFPFIVIAVQIYPLLLGYYLKL